ncbi:MAG: outer membrane lipoprotein carrier protein LolA, partial [Cruoricaptor ignavus]|nr:outer membrane lipoprotein carrier protein LolA [Cruoricaptor ignavus]
MNNVVKRVLIFSLIFGLIVSAFAQKSDNKSTTILDAVSAKYKANKNTYFKFAYGTGANGKVAKTQTGIFYTTPSQYKLKIMGIEQIFDGNKVYNISDEDQEITIAKATGNEMMFSPTNYLNNY